MSKRYPGNFITGNPVALSQTSNSGVWDLKDNYQATGNNTWQKSDGIYEIGRSLRFRNSANAHFNRTPAVASNRRTWTFSGWVKLGSSFGSLRTLFGGYSGTANGTIRTNISVYDDGTLAIDNQRMQIATDWRLYTTQLLRDPSAWYHIVFALDTTQSMDSNRAKLYVNGVQVSSFSTLAYPALNYDAGVNTTSNQYIGRYYDSSGGSVYTDAHMTEFNFVDGQQLDPSYFGYTDSITGIWQPKPYTGSYGTNGFYLPFSENSSTLNLGRNLAGSNYFTYSEQFDNAAWSKYQSSVTANVTTAPDGTTTADKLVGTTGTTGDHQVSQSSMVTAADNANYTFSCYAKAAERSIFRLYIQKRDGSTYAYSDFDLTAGQITTAYGGPYAGAIPTITYVGNGWYRCTSTVNVGTGSGGVSAIISYASATAETAGYGLYIWGAQINVGSTVDRYISTTSAASNNDWTPNNFSITAGATYDSMVDSPTNVFTTATDVGGVVPGNYCTLNPLDNTATISAANLSVTRDGTGAHLGTRGTIGITTGKWYWEATYVSAGSVAGSSATGVALSTWVQNDYCGQTGSWSYHSNGNKYLNGAGTAYGATYTTGDIIGVAFDADAGTITCYKNNASQGQLVSGLTSGPYFPAASVYASSAWSFNFGQRPFAYTPPTGFKSLNTTNIQALGTAAVANAAIQPNKWFDATQYGATAANLSVTNAGNFQPNLVWIKSRTSAQSHTLYDSVRGPTLQLNTNNTGAEGTYAGVNSFDSGGFSIGTADNNTSGNQYVAWQWKQSSTSGFNIISYTGNGSVMTISHNLGVAPKFIMIKERTSVSNWVIQHDSLGWTQGFLGFGGVGPTTTTAFSNNVTPTSSNFTVSAYSYGDNTLTRKYIAYLWAEVPGFSKIGTYTGNGSTDGTFVYTGFRPKYVLIKRITGTPTEVWVQADAIRNTNLFNPAQYYLSPDLTQAETTSIAYDFVSNGIKFKNNSQNESGSQYIYIAFAESPFALNNRAR